MPGYNPDYDKPSTPYLKGTFPAHVSGLEKRKYGDVVFHDVKFLIAEEANKVEGENKNGEKESAASMVGKEIRIKVMSFNPKPKKEDRWKNGQFYNYACAMGIKFDEITETFEGEKITSFDLRELEEDEILGVPVIVETDFIADKNDNSKKYCKVVNVLEWINGKPKTPDEIDAVISKDSDDENLPF